MNDENEIVPDDTGKQEAIQPAQEVLSPSPSPSEQVPPQEVAPTRKPEFGDRVRYVHGERTLDATVQVAFTNGTVNLRVEDASNAFGYFDVYRVVQDVSKASSTFHYVG